MTPHWKFPVRTCALAAVAALLALPAATVWASDAHAPAPKAAHKAEAKPEPKPKAEAPARAAPAGVDPLEALRDKLAHKLGATKAPEAASSYVVRVAAKAPEGSAHATPSAKVVAGHGGGLVAKLRAEKADKAHGGKGAASHAAHAPHWGYAGSEGPEAWGGLKPEFAKCSSGSRQSPIDIRGGVRVDLDPIQFDYGPSNFSVVDNGHTVQVNLGGNNSIEVMGRRYDLVQFHFHRPSEERVDGRRYDMSLHMVHKDPEGRLAVVAVLLERGGVHPVLQQVWGNLPLEKGDEVVAQAALDPSHLLPPDRRYFTYMGSLTTPPCSEGVLWLVMQQPVPVAGDQVAVFSRLYPMNARPIQSVAGRLIKASN